MIQIDFTINDKSIYRHDVNKNSLSDSVPVPTGRYLYIP